MIEENRLSPAPQTPFSEQKCDIASLTPMELSQYLKELSEKTGVKIPAFRTGQIFSWITSGARDFEEMTNLPKELRATLSENAYIATPTVRKKLVSAIDGTIKYLFELYDGECIESVFMR